MFLVHLFFQISFPALHIALRFLIEADGPESRFLSLHFHLLFKLVQLLIVFLDVFLRAQNFLGDARVYFAGWVFWCACLYLLHVQCWFWSHAPWILSCWWWMALEVHWLLGAVDVSFWILRTNLWKHCVNRLFTIQLLFKNGELPVAAKGSDLRRAFNAFDFTDIVRLESTIISISYFITGSGNLFQLLGWIEYQVSVPIHGCLVFVAAVVSEHFW